MRQARVADVDAARGERERSRDLLEALGLLGTLRRLRLGPAPLELPDGEPGLVGEPPNDRDRRRVGLVDGGLPRDDEDELGPPSDCDRRAEGGADAKLENALEALRARLGENIGNERDAEVLDRRFEAREVP